jgi:hypothetical protein
MAEKNIADEIIERMTVAYGLPTGRGSATKLAKKLGINASIVSGWRSRGVPTHIPTRVALDTGCREGWLLTGEGEMKSRPYPEAGEGPSWAGAAEASTPAFNGAHPITADEARLLRIFRALTTEERFELLLLAGSFIAGRADPNGA